MHALPPGEQDEIAATLAEQMKSMSGDERRRCSTTSMPASFRRVSRAACALVAR